MTDVQNEMANVISKGFSTDLSTNTANITTNGYISNGNVSSGLDYDKLTSAVVNALSKLNPQVILNREKLGEFVFDTISKEVLV
jgi:hypothetical protein